jgi:DNA-binding IclR family transcriptional regulator
MQNDYRNKVRDGLLAEEQALLQALHRTQGETDSGKTLRQLARELPTGIAELRNMLHKLQQLRLVENAPEGALSDGGRHYRLTERGRGMN